MAEPLLSLTGVSFAYGKTPILKNISLQLNPGETMGLTGANGGGKTTLFRCITGLEKIDSGTIVFQNRQIAREKDFQFLRKHLGYALQNPEDQLFFPTLLDDVCFGPLNLGFTKAEARDLAEKSLELTGLTGYEERNCFHLSGGEQRLAALAGILAMKPKGLLLDEPLNGLDPDSARRVSTLLEKLDCAKIIISHDLEFLKKHARVIHELKDGELAPSGNNGA